MPSSPPDSESTIDTDLRLPTPCMCFTTASAMEARAQSGSTGPFNQSVLNCARAVPRFWAGLTESDEHSSSNLPLRDGLASHEMMICPCASRTMSMNRPCQSDSPPILQQA